MTIYAGPCLLTPDQSAIDDCYKTAERLAAIDKGIRFRCKLWGGGTRPDRYVEGIGGKGVDVLRNMRDDVGIRIGVEIKDGLDFEYDFMDSDASKTIGKSYTHIQGQIDDFDFYWVAARSAQNYSLLKYIKNYMPGEILIKRHPGMTVDEIIGIHDICEKIHGYKPIIVERGINTFCRTEKQRWMPDFQGMLRILQERPDIELCFDVSHSCGVKDAIFPMVRAAVSLGLKNFMLEVMNRPELSQTDKAQILSIEEFREIYDYLKKEIQ
ncbi:MAG: hypothetical protein PHF37_09875 [Phycisphaerae bacterium]|nr:hypothetical protein [Phycisphaerae bacterium]